MIGSTLLSTILILTAWLVSYVCWGTPSIYAPTPAERAVHEKLWAILSGPYWEWTLKGSTAASPCGQLTVKRCWGTMGGEWWEIALNGFQLTGLPRAISLRCHRVYRRRASLAEWVERENSLTEALQPKDI